MKTHGKFVLFNFSEFTSWLESLKVKREIRLIQNHHTFQPDYKAFAKLPDHFHWLFSMESFQMLNGFSEIAQQLTTFPDGMIGVGRSFDTIPAGIKGANQFGVCMEHLGNFDVGGDVMTEKQKELIVQLNAVLCRKFGLVPGSDTIIYHHWYDIVTGKRVPANAGNSGNVKTCPGTNFFGGNGVGDCEREFIPLVKAVMLTSAHPNVVIPAAQ
jgi:hypothetical protein